MTDTSYSKHKLNPAKSTDTDKDGIPDWDEIDTYTLKFIRKYHDMLTGSSSTNLSLIDLEFDDEGDLVLPTLEECIYATGKGYSQVGLNRIKSIQNSGINSYVSIFTKPVLPIVSHPAAGDSDGDGLYDNKAQCVDGKKVAPKDTQPLKANGSKELWEAHIDRMNKGNIANGYSNTRPEMSTALKAVYNFAIYTVPALGGKALNQFTEEQADEVIKTVLLGNGITNSAAASSAILALKTAINNGNTESGAAFLNFVPDNKNENIYHSQVGSWQRNFGYNDMYDDVFDMGSSMLPLIFPFEDNDFRYRLWAWKGDYWNLGAGTEIGLYYSDKDENKNISVSGIEHYHVVKYELPMKLYLYHQKNNKTYENYFAWEPTQKQWWITGFNSDYKNAVASTLSTIGTVSFKDHDGMYEALKNYAFNMYDPKLMKNIIFDDELSTVWVIWDLDSMGTK